jgi:SPASM domain peptide maturase of grasp-with-spasm system
MKGKEIHDYKKVTEKFRHIFTITVFGCVDEYIYCSEDTVFGQIYFVEQNAFSEKDCGAIKPEFFTINLNTYTEALNHNSCLNRKISIDSRGYIKNCPSMEESFGHISVKNFKEVLFEKSFKKLWNITKDVIEDCKDCEFRYICTDCRAYLESPQNVYSKPLKCGYDPYTGIWSDWISNPIKEKAQSFYKFENIV